MTDATAEAAEFEHRLPAAQSQGFAHIRVVSVIDPYSTGPLGIPRADHPNAVFVDRDDDLPEPVLE
jgi:hypothetical protein